MSDEITNLTFLWVIPKWTLPATDGARVATDRLIRNMVKCGADIDVLCLGNPGELTNIDEMKSEWGVKNIFIKTRPLPQSKVGKLFFYLFKFISRPSCPSTMSSFDSFTVKDFINKTVAKKSYDFLFLDGLHLGAAFFEKGKFKKPTYCNKVIFRAHNIEQDIWTKAYQDTDNIFKKLLLKHQSRLVAIYEAEVIKGSDIIAPISKEDNSRILEDFPEAITHITLMGMDFANPLEYRAQDQDKIHFLFLGRLDWPPNRDGLKWLLDNVWQHIDHNKFHLDVAGSGDRSWLNSYLGRKGITFHGFVDDINDLYQKCSASLIPIFYGSGTRIKVVETYTKGRSMIATQMGAQGSGLVPDEHYINAETANDWIKSINEFDPISSRKFGEAGAVRLKIDFDEKLVATSLYNKLL